MAEQSTQDSIPLYDPELRPQYGFEPGEDVDIIFHNLYLPPSAAEQSKIFQTWRFQRARSRANINDILVQIGQHIAEDLYDVISLSASKHSCVVVIITRKSAEELIPRLRFPTKDNKSKTTLDELIDKEAGVVSLGHRSGKPNY